MHAVIVVAHPEPDSFNAQLARVAGETLEGLGHSVEISDLYRQGFDPLEGPRAYAERANPDRFEAQTEQRHGHERGTTPAEVAAEIARLDRADLLLIQYPMWWFSMPAMMKGWLDRVLTYGGVYTSRVRYDRGRFRGRRAMVSTTTGAPGPTHLPDGRNGDIDLLMWPMNFTLHYVGYTVLPHFVAAGIEGGIRYSSPEEVQARLAGHKQALAARMRALHDTPPLRFNGWDDWNEEGRLHPGAPAYSPFIRHQDQGSQ